MHGVYVADLPSASYRLSVTARQMQRVVAVAASCCWGPAGPVIAIPSAALCPFSQAHVDRLILRCSVCLCLHTRALFNSRVSGWRMLVIKALRLACSFASASSAPFRLSSVLWETSKLDSDFTIFFTREILILFSARARHLKRCARESLEPAKTCYVKVFNLLIAHSFFVCFIEKLFVIPARSWKDLH